LPIPVIAAAAGSWFAALILDIHYRQYELSAEDLRESTYEASTARALIHAHSTHTHPTIVLNGTIDGDLLVSGSIAGDLRVSGSIGGDLRVSGSIGGDLRVSGSIGGDLGVDGSIGGDLAVSGSVSMFALSGRAPAVSFEGARCAGRVVLAPTGLSRLASVADAHFANNVVVGDNVDISGCDFRLYAIKRG
jgi:hypothetical protein